MSTDRPRKALIPAAGRGTRFLPLTKAVPKELAPIVTTPTLEIVIGEAADNDISEVLLVVSAGKTAINEYFAPAPELEAALEAKGDEAGLAAVRRPTELATISYVEQKEPRGLGHAIGHGKDFAAGEPLAVLLPDDLIDDRDALLGPMLDVYAEHGGIVLGLIDVGPVEISKYGCVVPAEGADPEGDVVAISDLVEKPEAGEAPSTLAIIGRYVLPPEIFAALDETEPGAGGEIQITDAMRNLCNAGTPVHGVVFRGRRYDTGDRLEYVKAVVQLAVRHPDIGADFQAWLRDYEPTDG
ncbi:MAG TPA: UTP--glucose-1-phosphate uridylyltransferase [Jatrophihabitans sp.]|jgi:UTP--glucose-1-phosphate uridylyltransferase|uniref:UTP--glucose-1-phosphate uridylyltransferase n=1 Tax=Jatrophihabitans sp. TaxID=1932789 RepID=UPI002E0AF6D0|nr:UTP--glucose-1-phosphate uridylyltransferase [Jatrophihabitans sp.]